MKENAIYLLVCLLLCLASCEDTNKIINEDAIVKITVLDGNGVPVSNKTVYMFTADYPITYTNVMFGEAEKISSDDFSKENATDSEVTDANGEATFRIDGGNLYGTAIFSILDLNKSFITVFPNYGGTAAATLSISNVYDEKPVFNNIVVTPNSDGTINIDFYINNTNIKMLSVVDANNNVVEDLLENNALDGSYFHHIVSQPLPVDKYFLYAKTKADETAKLALGEDIAYSIGGAISENGSYLSIIDNRQLTMDEAQSQYKAEVIAVSSADGYEVTGLKAATNARSADVAANAGKVAFFQDGNRVITDYDNGVGEGGIIITESGCICKINSITDTPMGDATINMYTIKSNDQIKVDCNVLTFSK